MFKLTAIYKLRDNREIKEDIECGSKELLIVKMVSLVSKNIDNGNTNVTYDIKEVI